jgi:poly-gamma-glutamate capsule biosynthesis protein CapA/YwtB (metallophosphatase superfamily)
VLAGPRVVATGVPIRLSGRGIAPGSTVRLELLGDAGFRVVGDRRADRSGRVRFSFRPRRLRHRYRFRLTNAAGALLSSRLVKSRDVTLSAVGDINLGDGPAGAMARHHSRRYPWTGVARVLRRSDAAFGNLECAVSRRGHAVPKQFNFRGHPSALRVVARYAGIDVLNLANNHTGDFGRGAMLDTVRNVRRFGMVAVGAGGSTRSARRPRVIRRLGLRIAFVGFSDIGPFEFGAGPHTPGTQLASPAAVANGVRAARRHADVVIATFHWGEERHGSPSGRQRSLARVALAAGAHAVIGAHPHVLQPIRRRGRHRVVAYSLGNFVFSANSPGTTRTGILRLKLSTRGVDRVRLIRARIADSRPHLVH